MNLTFSMNKMLCVLALYLSITSMAKAQNTYYYKLTRKVVNGTSSTNVSGGQYITFIADICYESNKKGIGVGHGNMTRNNSFSTSEYTTYFGSSYWGDNAASFKFNADKSVMNVVIDKNNYYIYKRVTAPAGQETCSLIRKKSTTSGNNNGSFAGGFPPQPVYPNQPYTSTPTPTPTPTSTPTSTTEPKRHQCGLCGGTGEWVHDDASIPDFGTGNKYCSKCGKTVGPKHVHTQCPSCKGKGWW